MSDSANPTAGGTPGPGGTPGQSGTQTPPPAQQPPTSGTGGTPADGGTPSTPEDVTGLKSALQAERDGRQREADARRTAEQELERIKTASLSDQEKATKEAVGAARAEERGIAKGAFRSLRVETSLIGAGMKPGMARDLATSSRFASLEVKDDFSIDQAALDAVIGELKTAEPSFFAATAPPAGQPSRGPQHQPSAAATATPGVGRLRAVERNNTSKR